MVRAVQPERDAASDAAGYGNCDGRIIPNAVIRHAWIRHSRQENKLGHLASVQRQLQNTLIVHDGPHAGVSRFNQSSVGAYLDRLSNLTDLEDGINGGVAIDLKHDSSLHVSAEARQRCFDHVRPERKIGKHVAPVLARYCGPHRAGGGLSGLDLDAGQDGSAGVFHDAGDLSRRLRPSVEADHATGCKTDQHKKASPS